jgi:hypothetical protein
MCIVSCLLSHVIMEPFWEIVSDTSRLKYFVCQTSLSSNFDIFLNFNSFDEWTLLADMFNNGWTDGATKGTIPSDKEQHL